MGILDAPVRNVVPKITAFDPPLVAGVSASSHPTVIGTASPRSGVTLFVNGTAVASGTADSAGAFAIALPAQLNGTINLIARATPASDLTALVINDPKQPLENAAGVPAVFELDNERSLFYTNSTPYADLTSLAGAIGGTASGILLSCGGYTDPAGTNILTNGTFDTVTTGWTAGGSGALAIASGEMQFTINAASDSFTQTITGYPGRAFAYTGTGRRGTNTTNSPQMMATTTSATLGGNVTSAPAVTGSNSTSKLHLAAQASTWVGVKAATGLGTTLWDNFSVVEAQPLLGWNTFATSSGSAAPSFSVLVDAVTPAALPSTGQVKVIWQADTDTRTNGSAQASQRDSIRLHWSDTGAVIFTVRLNNTVILSYTLGTVAVSTRFRVALGASVGSNGDATTGYAATLNGANCQSLFTSSTLMVGVSHMRIGQEANGTAQWDGSFNRVAVVRGRQQNDWLEAYSALPTATPRVFGGDSYMGGAGGVVLPDLYETASGKVTINIGVGGSTLAAQVTNITSRPYLRSMPLVHWDGSNNGMVDIASQVALAQQIWDWKGNGRILWMPSIAVPNPGTASSATPSTYAAYLRDYRDALIAAFGASHVYDPMPVLQGLATASADDVNDVAAGLVPRSTMLTQGAGEVHLGNAAMNAIATNSTFQSKIAAL